MFDELKWRYEILLDMYRGKEVTMKCPHADSR